MSAAMPVKADPRNIAAETRADATTFDLIISCFRARVIFFCFGFGKPSRNSLKEAFSGEEVAICDWIRAGMPVVVKADAGSATNRAVKTAANGPNATLMIVLLFQSVVIVLRRSFGVEAKKMLCETGVETLNSEGCWLIVTWYSHRQDLIWIPLKFHKTDIQSRRFVTCLYSVRSSFVRYSIPKRAHFLCKKFARFPFCRFAFFGLLLRVVNTNW